jgi:hypothetical protein
MVAIPQSMRHRNLLWGALLSALLLLAFGCTDSESIGACSTTDASAGDGIYCYNGWTAAECSVYNAEQVNGGNWTFSPGQTCSAIGLPADN